MTLAYLAAAVVLLATLATLGAILVRAFLRRRLYLRHLRGE